MVAPLFDSTPSEMFLNHYHLSFEREQSKGEISSKSKHSLSQGNQKQHRCVKKVMQFFKQKNAEPTSEVLVGNTETSKQQQQQQQRNRLKKKKKKGNIRLGKEMLPGK